LLFLFLLLLLKVEFVSSASAAAAAEGRVYGNGSQEETGSAVGGRALPFDGADDEKIGEEPDAALVLATRNDDHVMAQVETIR